MQTDFVRSLNCNYERILPDSKPEERKYQYCMLTRGGIKGLLSCSLRYLNGVGYLYYDISSKQNIYQRYSNKLINREWIEEFLWSYEQIRQELERFLLDVNNVLWFPEQIFQEPETNAFSFLYVPYYEGENGFRQLMEFWIERIDYDDEVLVDCIYHMYEQYEINGEAYLQTRIFEDAENLNKQSGMAKKEDDFWEDEDEVPQKSEQKEAKDFLKKQEGEEPEIERQETEKKEIEHKKHIFGLFESKKKKNKDLRERYRKEMHEKMYEYAVAEESSYEEEEYGRTIYIDSIPPENQKHRLHTDSGRTLRVLEESEVTIGKKKGEADIILEDASVSRLHARILKEDTKYYVEDLNSTNGTFKNGLRLQPYEKRLLEEGDEITVGRVMLRFD